jgi:hypothetical protein
MQASDFEKPFSVEFSNDVNVGECQNFKTFDNFRDARTYFDERCKAFRAVWFSEIGKYETYKGNTRYDWIYFDWSKDVASSEGSEPVGRGTGYPSDYPNQWVSYDPYRA